MRLVWAGIIALSGAFAATHANAEGTIAIEGLFLWGYDRIYLGEPPEDPGVVDFGNGWSAGGVLTIGAPDLFGQLTVRYLATANHAEAVHSSIFGTTFETVDVSKRFIWADLDIGTAADLGGGATLAVSGGVRFLDARHNIDDRAITTGGFFETDILGRDRVVFRGAGPHLSALLTVPASQRVSLFVGAGGCRDVRQDDSRPARRHQL